MRAPRWEHDVENWHLELGERAAWLAVLEDAVFLVAERLELYLGGAYGRVIQQVEREESWLSR